MILEPNILFKSQKRSGGKDRKKVFAVIPICIFYTKKFLLQKNNKTKLLNN